MGCEMDKYITEKEFNKFLEELNVVFADISVDPKFAWEHYNKTIFDLKNKHNMLNKKGVKS